MRNDEAKLALTPIRHQYLRLKQRYPQAILFFRLGDFYETFDEDAHVTARELEITLTSREMGKGKRIPMAGIPYHALDNYLGKLIAKGYKVAICEQLSDPATSRGLVERDVVRVVTPGTLVEPGLLESKANNYLAAVVVEGNEAGIAYIDVTTAEFATAQLGTDAATLELERLRPAELLIPSEENHAPNTSAAMTRLDGRWWDLDTAKETLLEHFGVLSLEGYGCAHLPLAIRAAGAIVHYLQETQKTALGQLSKLTTYSTDAYMVLDAQTRRNLELFQGGRQGSAAYSLLAVIDHTRTAMGSRLLKRWLGQPLLVGADIERRLDAVESFYQRPTMRAKVETLLRHMADMERLVSRTSNNLASPRELGALRRGLEAVPFLAQALEEADSLGWLKRELRPHRDLAELLAHALVDDPPPNASDGGVIRPGFSPELDEIRRASQEAKEYLASLERKERERTGIRSLRVGYNRVFGYYLEVSKPNLPQVPQDYIRKQTLVGAERYYTPQLKEYESLILNAQERMMELESNLFRQVCSQVGLQAESILATAAALAQTDVFCALAEVAARYNYTRPQLSEGSEISITAGRHPVVERFLDEDPFVPNDTYISSQDTQLIILTGPNMAGKSTYLKQVALIVLLAQIGSFVPAAAASISLVDRIFTRIGAQEDLATGQSTFMVEMVETANILNHATQRSLVILDEIGRGTSTYDGISIARAVVEYIHNHPRLGAKTLFATHYHELVDMAQVLPRVRNFNFAVAEEDGKVIFLRKIIPGGTDRSYGIHVAQLAGLPRSVVSRAEEVLRELESDQRHSPRPRRRSSLPPEQLPLLRQPSPAVEELLGLDIHSLTPLEAITKLYELQKKAREEQS